MITFHLISHWAEQRYSIICRNRGEPIETRRKCDTMDIYNLLIVLAALLATESYQVSAQCPTECTCANLDQATCDDVTAPPPGYWPSIDYLYLQGSKIVKLENYALAGFPNLRGLWLNQSSLEEMHMGAFQSCPLLNFIFAGQTLLRNIIPPLPGQTFPSLRSMYIFDANLTTLPEDLLAGSQVEMLEAGTNPQLILPTDRPLVTSSTLKHFVLWRIGGGRVTKATFQGVPNVEILDLSGSNVSEIGDGLSTLDNVKYLDLSENPLEEIKKGAFSSKTKISALSLMRSALKTLEIAAIDGIVVGSLDITDTPLACSCSYEALFWWARANNVKLYHNCENVDCGF